MNKFYAIRCINTRKFIGKDYNCDATVEDCLKLPTATAALTEAIIACSDWVARSSPIKFELVKVAVTSSNVRELVRLPTDELFLGRYIIQNEDTGAYLSFDASTKNNRTKDLNLAYAFMTPYEAFRFVGQSWGYRFQIYGVTETANPSYKITPLT